MEESNVTEMSLQFSEYTDSKTDIKENPQNFEHIVVKEEVEPDVLDVDIKTIECVDNEIEDVSDLKPENIEIKQDLQEIPDESRIEIEETENYDVINNINEQAYNSSNQTFSCNKCNYTSTKRRYMHKHLKVHSVPYDLTKTLKCKQCSFVTQKNANFREHALSHKKERNFECDVCNYKTHNKRYLKCHVSRHDTVILNCNLCSYKTSRKHLLNLHAKIHVPKKVYKCDQCEYKTNTKIYFKKHILVHTVDNLCICDECGSEFKGPYNLKNHKRNFHSKTTPFLCDVCGYKVTKRSMFNEHMKTHTGELYEKKPYQCEHCPYFFVKRYQLTKHMEMHLNERFYHCDQCNYKTENITNLVPHMKTHLNA